MLRLNWILSHRVAGAVLAEGKRLTQTAASSPLLHPKEPAGPMVQTDIPGPRSKALLHELDQIQNVSAIQYFVDYDKSQGNYLVDADDNIIMDLMMQISSQALGYNHPNLIRAMQNPANMSDLVNRPCLGVWPSVKWAQKLQDVLLTIAPAGMKNVTTMACGACSVEHAMKAAFMAYRRKQRGGAPPTKEEMESSLLNKAPGSPPLTVLSFDNAFHGRTMGCLNLTHTKWTHKMDFPAMDWPIVNFPKCRYPLESHIQHNQAEENRSLAEIRRKIEEYNAKGTPVAGVIVEPIQGEGGDNQASADYFRQVQQICKEYGSCFIVDEVQSGGGATGRWWFHENWNLPSPPDLVTFSKRMLTGGFYHTDEMRPTEGYRIFNTWMGDPSKIVLLEEMINTVRQYNLLDSVKAVGLKMIKGLEKLEKLYPNQINSPRGHGVILGVDGRDPGHRDKLVAGLLKKGIMTGGNGIKTVRMRPCLIFQPHHADIFLDIFDQVLQENK